MSPLADRLERLAERGPRRHPEDVLTAAYADARPSADHRPDRTRMVIAAALLVAVLGVAAIWRLRLPSGDDVGLAAEPAASLPETPDLETTPVTVFGTEPVEWFRLQPDLDVAWYSTNDGPSMLCFRTPTIDEECQPDEFRATDIGGGPIGVATAGDQLLVLTLDEGDVIRLTEPDGRVISAPVGRHPEIGWGIARFDPSPAERPVELTAMYGES